LKLRKGVFSSTNFGSLIFFGCKDGSLVSIFFFCRINFQRGICTGVGGGMSGQFRTTEMCTGCGRLRSKPNWRNFPAAAVSVFSSAKCLSGSVAGVPLNEANNIYSGEVSGFKATFGVASLSSFPPPGLAASLRSLSLFFLLLVFVLPVGSSLTVFSSFLFLSLDSFALSSCLEALASVDCAWTPGEKNSKINI